MMMTKWWKSEMSINFQKQTKKKRKIPGKNKESTGKSPGQSRRCNGNVRDCHEANASGIMLLMCYRISLGL